MKEKKQLERKNYKPTFFGFEALRKAEQKSCSYEK